ncbi:MAG: DNA-directed DNA polymerase [Candidatus Diapherotrites archaeon]
MVSAKIRGILLDVSYSVDGQKEISLLLYVKTKKGMEVFKEKKFKPYLYALVDDAKKRAAEISENEFGEDKARPLKAEAVKMANAPEVVKIFFRNTNQLVQAREEIKGLKGVIGVREYDIPFTRRFLIDKGIEPMNWVEIELDGDEIESIKKMDLKKDVIGEMNIGAFDLETYSPGRFSNPEKDPILMAAVAGKDMAEAITYKKLSGKGAKVVKSEKEMVQELLGWFVEKEIDIVVTYNGDSFDFPYLRDRGKKIGVDVNFGIGGEPKFRKKGLDHAAQLKGIQHLDAYQMLRLLAKFGVVSLIKYDLESVVERIFGKTKEKIGHNEINELWDRGELEGLAKYNREDALYTLKLAEEYLPLLVEFCKIAHMTLFDVNRASSSQLVESLLIEKSLGAGHLIPNKPSEEQAKQRMMQTFKGGYVKEPIAGLHENIAVLDFRSLHPTIIISHNISPETLKCNHESCKKGKNISPDKDWFCEKQRGFFPEILEEILANRIAVKGEMKKHKPGSKEYRLLDARQHALKILLNSHYGYLAFARARWYSRESARAVTAWSRHYIKEVMHKAEEDGFTPIYSDTDSLFILVPKDRGEKEVEQFAKKINSELPGAMELEFEGFFKRGIFVSKRDGGAAKKRYALIDFDDNLKIVGFEYVRRDWSGIAKQTQRDVLQAVLKEGKPEKAGEIIRERVKALKNGEVKKKDLTIMTNIQRPLNKYVAIGPHIAAARKAVERGKELGVGSTISYIITRKGKSISDKAELEEYVKEGEYDADYYISNQLLPAVIKIMRELGFTEEDLKEGGKQRTLSSFS